MSEKQIADGTLTKRPAVRTEEEPDPAPDVVLTPELIETFLQYMGKKRAESTVITYQRQLSQLYTLLPEDKTIRRGSLEALRTTMLGMGYAPRTINGALATVNGLMDYCGHGELRIPRLQVETANSAAELTRTEYLRLLRTARSSGKRKEYLLVKLFVTTGLSLQELPELTVEAVKRGRIYAKDRTLYLSAPLRRELQEYVRQEQLFTGPVFVGAHGRPLTRGQVTLLTESLSGPANVEQEKASPRCLRRLYQSTQDELMQHLNLMVEQAYEHLLNVEQRRVGWGK